MRQQGEFGGTLCSVLTPTVQNLLSEQYCSQSTSILLNSATGLIAEKVRKNQKGLD